MNRTLILRFAFPITLIAFAVFTKWWLVDVVDGTDGLMYGFPFIYRAPAFYTSMAEEYFMDALAADFIMYFGIITGIIYSVNRWVSAITVKKGFSVVLFVIALLLIGFRTAFTLMPENRFSLTRDYDIVIRQTGMEFPGNDRDRSAFDDRHK
ncbi:hypothetical protein [Flavobacterium sp.]|uniref:hypothetical protein n=1 Tax=Flavobacterium sp. TaxID=239 RepID=UPI0026375848|nr:hypothetical protein [Flavobacterium sp.]